MKRCPLSLILRNANQNHNEKLLMLASLLPKKQSGTLKQGGKINQNKSESQCGFQECGI